jgi:bacillithiol biosynthesis cysteine-adding enzyme BshC
LDGIGIDRNSITQLLVQQNQHLGAPPEAIKAAEELAQPGAVAAFTGQQAGLFGGPLYTIYKAMTLLGWAQRLRECLGRPVVPIFWIAADDHDFDEVCWTAFPDLENKVRRLQITVDGLPDRAPLAQVLLEKSVLSLQSEMRAAQLGTEFSEAVFGALVDDYAPGRSMVDAFGRWMARLLGPFGLVMFNPADQAAKRLWKPLFAEELTGYDETAAALTEINQRLEEAGYHQQVEHPERHTHLFCVQQGRHAVRAASDGHLSIDPEPSPQSRVQWLRRLETDPAAFSPGVLFRPVAQSYLFPVIAAVCGPSEIAYWAQSRALFDRFKVLMPVVLPRSSATIVEKKNRNAVDALGHDVSEFFGDIESVINRHFERSFPVDLERQFKESREEWDRRLEQLKSQVVSFEPTLAMTFEQSAGRIAMAWENLERKVFQAHKRKGDEIRAKFYKLATHLYPDGKPQERVFGISYYLNKYGFDFLLRVRGQLKIGTPDHQIIEP